MCECLCLSLCVFLSLDHFVSFSVHLSLSQPSSVTVTAMVIIIVVLIVIMIMATITVMVTMAIIIIIVIMIMIMIMTMIVIMFSGGLGNWSEEGCKFVEMSEGRVQCRCNHMTHFAVLFSVHGPEVKALEKHHLKALTIISYVGCAISLVGVTLTLLTYSLFR